MEERARSAVPDDVVARVRAGDARALESLFRAFYAPLCEFAVAYVHSPALAEELVQDIFAEVWARRAAWTVHTSVRSYLFGATRNRALNARKRERVERDWQDAVASGEPVAIHAYPPRPDEVLELAEAAGRVRAAVARLPERCRLVMELRWQQGLSYAEIAEVMGISLKGVENQLARGLKALRGMLSV